MRVLNWNIGHGGGSRILAICGHIEDVNPDLLALTEFRNRNEPALRTELKRLGYPFIATSNPVGKQNGLLIASRWRLEHDATQYTPDIDRERWLTVRLNEVDLDLLVVHIPGTPDNKFDDGYGISGAKRKQLLWEHIGEYAEHHKDRPAIIMGDFNTGFRIDAEGAMFVMSQYMTNLLSLGFVDAWRHLHSDVRDYTWYSRRRDKATGKSEDLNGFRLDYIFVSPALRHAIADVAILHEPRRTGASDHASVVANIDIPIGTDEFRGNWIRETEGPADWPVHTENAADGNLRARLDLPAGSLPDMTCGRNGQNFVQHFRPTHITAEWADNVLKEVRIWGPQLLKDGSLGKRLLDHVWTRPVAAGGVNYDELPSLVAAQLRAYVTADGLAPADQRSVGE